LVGPPGTGKTLLARAVAGEANCGFYAFSGSSFVEVFVGLGAARIRKLFKEAKRRSPAIIFIDELDALGRTRGGSLHFPGSEERENTLNQLLVEMDGFEPSSKLVIIAATNRPDVLDSALTRPGRFDREITIDLPDLKSREEILNLHKNGKPFDTSISFQGLASQTAGLSGADLANLLNEAAIQAARQNELIITKLHLEKALDRILMGSERPEVLSNPKEKNQVAVHEIGHALVMSLLPNPTPLHKVNLVSRGKALGATIPIGKDQQLATYSELQNRLASLLAGRAAEELTFGKDSISTSAADDLERASQLAKDMITKFGMGSTLQTISDSNLQEQRVYQEQIESLLKTAFEKSTSLLQEHKDKLASLSALLQEKETLEGGEFQALLS
jgi:cell division protease FtsH